MDANPAAIDKNAPYQKPEIVDFGSLVQLTAANGLAELEDGVGKVINTDGSNGFVP